MSLNRKGLERCEQLAEQAEELRIEVCDTDQGSRVIDFGVTVIGGLEAGRGLAEVCLGGAGKVDFVSANSVLGGGPAVRIMTDEPIAACLCSQYAGWRLQSSGYFAMASGPMRSVAIREPLFEKLKYAEAANSVVGVLESGKLPPEEVLAQVADECGVAPSGVTLLVAPTASMAGTVQIVARSLETAIHKLNELDFDIFTIRSGWGVAPLPPIAADDLVGIGRTNDAVLYGGEVVLWVEAKDEDLQRIGPQVPSNASADHGQPFGQLFEKYDHDFYRIDPLLFSPAVVTFCNLRTGRSFRFGELRPDLLRLSFETKAPGSDSPNEAERSLEAGGSPGTEGP